MARVKQTLTESERRSGRLIPAPVKGKELFNLSYVSRTLAGDSTVQIPKITTALNNIIQYLRAKGEDELRSSELRIYRPFMLTANGQFWKSVTHSPQNTQRFP
jgi:hypothetical protein